MAMGLSIAPAIPAYSDRTDIRDAVDGCESLTEKLTEVVKLLKCQDIRGCITGSSLIPGTDFDMWDSVPDIDVFTYSPYEQVHACDVVQYKLGMEPGTGTERSKEQEVIKLNRMRASGPAKKLPVTTSKFSYDGIVVNVTYKTHKGKPIDSVLEVLGSFDMSIVMIGYDIEKGYTLDLRTGDPNVAVPNPMRSHDFDQWTVAKWVRQFDRVIKYYARGFDTRPMARFYMDMIDGCLARGCAFDTDRSKESFAEFAKEFVETRTKISDWYEEHKED